MELCTCTQVGGVGSTAAAEVPQFFLMMRDRLRILKITQGQIHSQQTHLSRCVCSAQEECERDAAGRNIKDHHED